MYPLIMNAPPSPPETNVTLGPSPAHGPQPHRPTAHGSGGLSAYQDSASVAGPALRRQPSIFYNSPGYRAESRERTSSMSAKLLVVVVPPVSVAQEHGNLGHTLSCGPAHRLPQGIVMPLFPNMYGQLTAIAKEFNFPSIAGLCLYYCYHDGEFSMTPRLSEEIWASMWGLPEAASQPRDRRPPIVGKLEFDIDMGKARWYTAWLSSRQRETATEYPFYHVPVTAPTQHFRGDSRFTFPQTVPTDDISEPVQLQHSAPVGKHVPRKLSLVERFDAQSSHGTDAGAHAHDPHLATGLPVSSILSPIKQQEEPKSARAELDNKVNTWRATAVASPVPLEASLQPESVLEPPTPSEVALRMEDYQWSISSAGPDDSASVSWSSDVYAPSIHLADRVNGSVASTASYCTSTGPSDYSVWFSLVDSRIQSPDVAQRMFEDVPPTPSTVTSWGAPTHYSASLYSEEYEPSIDLGHRGQFSRPTTPFTATSWGASTGPSSPLSPYRLPTPDIAQRSFEDVAQMVLQRWPGRPWRHAWPYNRKTEGRSQLAPSRWVPTISKVIQRKKKQEPTSTPSEASPDLVYPHFDLYPAASGHLSFSVEVAKHTSQLDFDAYPHNLKYIYPASTRLRTVDTRPGAQYPSFEIYPPVHPINPGETLRQESGIRFPSTDPDQGHALTGYQYPFFELYAHVYPFNLDCIYLSVKGVLKPARTTSQTVNVRTNSPYPRFEIYPGVYPFNLEKIYATIPGVTKPQPSPGWPPALHVKSGSYPFFEIYRPVYPWNLDAIYPAVKRSASTPVTIGYPHLAPSPASPSFDLYPQVAANFQVHASQPPRPHSVSNYPYFNLYLPAYPHFDLYPRVSEAFALVMHRSTKGLSPSISTPGYPYIVLYPAVYPHFSLYPALVGRIKDSADLTPLSVSNSTTSYPIFALYPPVYPHFNLYPAVAGQLEAGAKSKLQSVGPVNRTGGYPQFTLYPPVYPHFSLYPSVAGNLDMGGPLTKAAIVTIGTAYPFFNIYPAAYPHFDLYPPVATCSTIGPKGGQKLSVPVTVGPGYPYFIIYPAVYPYFNLWPSLQHSIRPRPPTVHAQLPPAAVQPSLLAKSESQEARRRSGRLTHAELHAMVVMEGSRGKMWLDDALESFPVVPQGPPLIQSTASQPISRPQAPSINRPHGPSAPVGHGWTSGEHPPPPLRRHPFPTQPIPRPASMLRTHASSEPRSSMQQESSHRSNSVSVRARPPSSTQLPQRRSMWEASPAPTGPLPTRPLTVTKLEPRRRDSLVSQRVKAFTTVPPVPPSSDRYL